MKETCYKVKMTGCRVKIKGFGRVANKVSKMFQRVGKKGILRVKKRFRGWGKKGRMKNTLFKGEQKKRAPDSCQGTNPDTSK